MKKKPTLRNKILFIELDDIVVNFSEELNKRVNSWGFMNESIKENALVEISQNDPNFYRNLSPIDCAIESINTLCDFYDIYFLSSPYSGIPSMYKDKRIWLEKHFGEKFREKLILTHRKDLQVGHYLIDRNLNNGSDKFINDLLLFGSDTFKNWDQIVRYLVDKYEVFWPETFKPKFRE
jgi:5'-nucleotidase